MTPVLSEDAIMDAVCEVTDLSPNAVLSGSRAVVYVQARWLAMYLARDLLALSFTQIGNYFMRDHTTVMYAVTKMDTLLGISEEARVCHREVIALLGAWAKEKRVEAPVA